MATRLFGRLADDLAPLVRWQHRDPLLLKRKHRAICQNRPTPHTSNCGREPASAAVRAEGRGALQVAHRLHAEELQIEADVHLIAADGAAAGRQHPCVSQRGWGEVSVRGCGAVPLWRNMGTGAQRAGERACT